MPVEFINKNVFARIPPIDADNVSRTQYKEPNADVQQAVIVFNIFYQGVDAVPSEYTEPLLAIGPAVTTAAATDYPGLNVPDATLINDTVCTQHDAVNMMFPISIKTYNVEAVQAAFDLYNEFTEDPTYYNSAVLFEGYSSQAVKAVPSDSTAFPFRKDNFLVYVHYPAIDFVV
jgi:hypothetical protein